MNTIEIINSDEERNSKLLAKRFPHSKENIDPNEIPSENLVASLCSEVQAIEEDPSNNPNVLKEIAVETLVQTNKIEYGGRLKRKREATNMETRKRRKFETVKAANPGKFRLYL